MGKIRDVISAARTAYPSEAPEFIFMFYMFIQVRRYQDMIKSHKSIENDKTMVKKKKNI
jgi:hypothetical protein